MATFSKIGNKLVLVNSASPEKKKRTNVESDLQKVLVNWFRHNYKESEAIICGVPNGAAVSSANRKRLISEGLYSGFSDLLIISKNGVFFVEVKTDAKSSKQSKEQKDFEIIVSNFGYKYAIVRSLEDFILFCSQKL